MNDRRLVVHLQSVSSDVSGLRADVNLQVEEQQKNLQSLHAQLEVHKVSLELWFCDGGCSCCFSSLSP